jgi:hypothetical protein
VGGATRRKGHPRLKTGSGTSAERSPAGTGKLSVLLAYALDGAGNRVHVDELDPSKRRARAPFRCLGCGEELLPHLGRIRARHFAHRPDSVCPLTAPESALHFNAKVRLLELCRLAFSGERKVILEARCPRCRRQEPQDLAGLGDGAILEGMAGRIRADVLVTRNDEPALVMEVLVTHGLDDEKEHSLTELASPTAEIDARDPWESERAGAIAIACHRSFGFTLCSSCESEERSALGRSAGGEAGMIAELESYRTRGLFGPRPGRPLSQTTPFSPEEVRQLTDRFGCVHCGGSQIEIGDRIATHACAGRSSRAVAWRGHDGALVVLEWWRRR